MTKRRKPQAPKTQDISLTISHIGHGGDGVGTYNGKPVYIPKSAAGDTLTARITESKDDFKGHILSIQTPSPERITPPCPHFEHCGGCDLQHISERTYHDWKMDKVKTTLARNGITPQHWEAPAFLPAATRRRTTLAIMNTKEKLYLGYHAPRSHVITDIEHCLILDSALDTTLQKLRPYLQKLAPIGRTVDITLQNAGGLDIVLTGEWGAFNLAHQETLAIMIEDLNVARISRRENEISIPEILLTRHTITKKFGALNVPLPPATFLQASDLAEDILVQSVMTHAQGAKNIADLFCGCGTFAGHLLETGARVHAIDSDPSAINVLKHPKLTTEKRNLFKDPLSRTEMEEFDCIVFDPPRAGAKAQTEILAQSNIPKLIAVSCNPATFARDAKLLIDGGYTLQSLRLIDQFTYSAHIEIAALFTCM